MHRRLRRYCYDFKRTGKPIAAFAVFSAFTILAVLAVRAATPAILEETKLLLNTSVTSYVSEAISQCQTEGLVTLEKNASGDITAICINSAELNRIQSGVTKRVFEMLSSDEKMDVKVPIGCLFPSTLLYGRGPSIKVRVLSVSNLHAEMRNEFESTGINQTLHRVLLDFTVGLDILLPSGREHDDVCVTMIVAETVIVGDTPQIYKGG